MKFILHKITGPPALSGIERQCIVFNGFARHRARGNYGLMSVEQKSG
jgi:hypothetical protein